MPWFLQQKPLGCWSHCNFQTVDDQAEAALPLRLQQQLPRCWSHYNCQTCTVAADQEAPQNIFLPRPVPVSPLMTLPAVLGQLVYGRTEGYFAEEDAGHQLRDNPSSAMHVPLSVALGASPVDGNDSL